MRKHLRIAVLDLYNNVANIGLDSIVKQCHGITKKFPEVTVDVNVFPLRSSGERPIYENHDVFISSGGPGDPHSHNGESWETDLFELVGSVLDHNNHCDKADRKFMLFICHSFQLICRHYGFVEVTAREKPSFGIYPAHKTENGVTDPLFEGLDETFTVGDFRWWQVVNPNYDRIEKVGAKVILMEKERPHVTHPQAIMGIRLSNEVVGVQFHPEAEPETMLEHFLSPHMKETVVRDLGPNKYERMITKLRYADDLKHTHDTVIPNFLSRAIRA